MRADQLLVASELSRSCLVPKPEPAQRRVQAPLCGAGLLSGVLSGGASERAWEAIKLSVVSCAHLQVLYLGWFWFLTCIILVNQFKSGGTSHLAGGPAGCGGLTPWGVAGPSQQLFSMNISALPRKASAAHVLKKGKTGLGAHLSVSVLLESSPGCSEPGLRGFSAALLSVRDLVRSLLLHKHRESSVPAVWASRRVDLEGRFAVPVGDTILKLVSQSFLLRALTCLL